MDGVLDVGLGAGVDGDGGACVDEGEGPGADVLEVEDGVSFSGPGSGVVV